MIVGIGIDIVTVSRIRRLMARHGDRFLAKVFNAEEIAYAHDATDPVPRLAARFAAKEAAVKALGTGIGQFAGWRDIDVCRDATTGAPSLDFKGDAQTRARLLHVDRIHVTLSHETDWAMAVVILETNLPHPTP